MKKNDHLNNRNLAAGKADSAYPFRTEWNENGEIVYHVPVEARSQEALATLEAAQHDGIHYLRFGEGERIPVVFIRTTNRAFAYDQRRWLNSQHTRDRRNAQREIRIEGFMQEDEDDEGITREECAMLEIQEEGYDRVELDDLTNRIADYIGEKYPDNSLYRKIFEMTVQMMDVKEIAGRLGMKQQNIYYYINMNRKLASEYRDLYT